MDCSEAQVVRINVPTRKSADITIDLRQDGLMHLFTVDSMEGLSMLKSIDNDSIHSSNKSILEDLEAKTCNEIEANASLHHPIGPSTIIHLKIVAPDCQKEGDVCRMPSSEITEGIPGRSSPASRSNKNCVKVRSSLCEMQREVKKVKHQSDERTNILKEFEITKQLERLRTETKKVSRRKYTHHMERVAPHVQLNSPKSDASEKSANDISCIFNDDTHETNEPTLQNDLKNARDMPPINVDKLDKLPDALEPEETIDRAKEDVEPPASSKRKNVLLGGPQSKRMKLSSPVPTSEERKWVVFPCRSKNTYRNGLSAISRSNQQSAEDQHLEEDIPLLVRSDEDEDYSQIGFELLRLWKLNDGEIDELKKQVREEFEHKQKEHIMPLILNLSPDQIESTYVGVRDVMNMYDITEQDSDEESRQSTENTEEEGKLTELKSLDALYKEEFSKDYYRDLFNVVDGGSFWRTEEEHSEEKQTNYSRNRPKRSTVDYTPSAYAFIGFMEGRRVRHKSDSEDRRMMHKHGRVSNKEASSGDDFLSDCDKSLNSCEDSICFPNKTSGDVSLSVIRNDVPDLAYDLENEQNVPNVTLVVNRPEDIPRAEASGGHEFESGKSITSRRPIFNGHSEAFEHVECRDHLVKGCPDDCMRGENHLQNEVINKLKSSASREPSVVEPDDRASAFPVSSTGIKEPPHSSRQEGCEDDIDTLEPSTSS